MTEQHMQKYSGFELEDAEQIEAEFGKSASSFLKLKVGKNTIRVLPGHGGEKALKVVWEHQFNTPNGFVNFACPRYMAKRSCIACMKADSLKASGNPADYERAKDFFAKCRVYTNVIDRAEPEVGPKVWAFGKNIYQQLKDIRDDEDFGGDFTHPETGFDIVVNRLGTTKNDTKYFCKGRQQSPLGNNDWLEHMHSLTKYAAILSENEIRDRIAGGRKETSQRSGSSTIVDQTFDDRGVDDPPF